MTEESLDKILADIFPTDDPNAPTKEEFIEMVENDEITAEYTMSEAQRIEILNMLVTDLLSTVSNLATELQTLKDEVRNDREDYRRKK